MAIKGEKTISQIASVYEVHPTQIQAWKKTALSYLQDVFSDKRKKENQTQEQLINELYKIIGQREMELEWLKKNCSKLTHSEKLQMIEKDAEISLSRQAQILDISRSSIYISQRLTKKILS